MFGVYPPQCKKSRGIIFYIHSCYRKDCCTSTLVRKKHSLWAFWNAKPAGKQNQSACCDKPEEAACVWKARDFFIFKLRQLSVGLLRSELLASIVTGR